MRLPRQRTPHRPQERRGVHAVVLGAGLSGLSASRVLADHFDRVTLVERDPLPADGDVRRGVPQGLHAHVLLPGGADTLDDLFPGLLRTLQHRGAPTARSLSQLYLCPHGHLLCQEPDSREPLYGPSRPLLESTVLSRVGELGNVTVLDGHEVASLVHDAGEGRVTGVRLVSRADGGESELMADLVVLATGRGGRATAWLRHMGFPAPEEAEVPVGIEYVSGELRLEAGAVGGLRALMIGPTAEHPIGAVALVQEGERWIVSLFGYDGHHPPTEHGEWLQFGDQFLPSTVSAALRDAEPLSELQRHPFSGHLWRRYDKLEQHPGGFLVMGDAVCNLNPVYGQGMTVAVLEALALRGALRQGGNQLAARFYKAAAKVQGEAWTYAVGSDLNLPRHVVPGPRSGQVRARNAYVDRFLAAAERDPVLARRFLDVTGFKQPPSALVGPSSLRHLTGRARAKRRSGAAQMASWP